MTFNVGKKIRELRHEKNLSLDDLGRLTGLTGAFLGRLERGEEKYKNPTIETLETISNGLGVTIIDLLPQKPGRTPLKKPEPKERRIPIVGYVNAGKGKSHVAWDDQGLPAGHGFDEVFDTEVKDPQAYGLEIRGDSMLPFEDGKWWVIAEPNREYKTNELVVARLVDDDVVFKKLTIQGDHYILESGNPAYRPMIFKKKDFISIHRVRGVFQK